MLERNCYPLVHAILPEKTGVNAKMKRVDSRGFKMQGAFISDCDYVLAYSFAFSGR